MVSSAPVECTSSGGLLTVNDSVSGGGAASSIDSGSEDEREGASIKDSGVNVSMSGMQFKHKFLISLFLTLTFFFSCVHLP